MRSIDWIVCHTAGAFDAKARRVVHQKVEVVRAFHKLPIARYDAKGKLVPGTGGRGYDDIGYHRYIEVDGKVRLGRLDRVVGAHAHKFNTRSLGVCCSGHGDHEPWNRAQINSLVAQCVAWCRLYTLTPDRIVGHKETELHGGPHVPKSCPGTLVNMDVIRGLVRDELAGVNRGGLALDDDTEPPSTRREGKPKV